MDELERQIRFDNCVSRCREVAESAYATLRNYVGAGLSTAIAACCGAGNLLAIARNHSKGTFDQRRLPRSVASQKGSNGPPFEGVEDSVRGLLDERSAMECFPCDSRA